MGPPMKKKEARKLPAPNTSVVSKFARGAGVSRKEIRHVRDKKAKGFLSRVEKQIDDAAVLAARSKILLTEQPGSLEAEGLEKTYKFTQQDIAKHVPIASARKIFNLTLPYGPYALDYSRNGRFLLLGGEKGHVAGFDWKSGKLLCEAHIGEVVYDVKWLHNETMFAVAQKKYTYIYDNTGAELHVLRNHMDATVLDFLPYHMLLTSCGKTGMLRYQDVSTGLMPIEMRTKLGRCDVMKSNPQNAIVHLGHMNGTVTLWSPNSSSFLVKLLCHKGPVRSLCIDSSGTYMATAGMDSQVKIWDIRTYKALQQYYTTASPTSVDISQLGLLSVTYGSQVVVWKDALKSKAISPYMHHQSTGSPVREALFCPFDDVLGFGHVKGASTILVPGSGEPNYDSLEANPFQTKRQRREAEVKSLLDKVPWDMITLDTDMIGKMKDSHDVIVEWNRQVSREANAGELEEERRGDTRSDQEPATRRRARGRSSTLRRYLKKQQNVIDVKKLAVLERLEKEKRVREEKGRGGAAVSSGKKARSPLDRFRRKDN